MCILSVLLVFSDIVIVVKLYLCVSFAFYERFSLGKTVIVVLQCALNYRVYETLLLMFQSKSGVVESPCGCCVVHPSSGLSYVQD